MWVQIHSATGEVGSVTALSSGLLDKRGPSLDSVLCEAPAVPQGTPLSSGTSSKVEEKHELWTWVQARCHVAQCYQGLGGCRPTQPQIVPRVREQQQAA